MLSKKEFQTQLEQELTSKITLQHPIFNLVFTKKDVNLLKLMALQGYQLTLNFIDYIERLYFFCPLLSHKKALLYNLFEESTGYFSKTKNHVHLMQDFLSSLSITEKEVLDTRPFPATLELINYRKNLINQPGTYHMGAAAVMIASEGQNLETTSGNARAQLLKQQYNLTDNDLLFFSIHQKEDVAHVREGYALVVDLCTNKIMQDEALASVRHTCALFYDMYSAIAYHHSHHN